MKSIEHMTVGSLMRIVYNTVIYDSHFCIFEIKTTQNINVNELVIILKLMRKPNELSVGEIITSSGKSGWILASYLSKL